MRILQRRFALIRRFVLGVLLLVPLVFAQGTQPQAAIVQLDGSGLPTGIRDLQVGSEFFHIIFVEGTYNAVFPGGETFSNASSIVDEIVLVLNALGTPAPQLSQIFSDPREFNIPIFTLGADRFQGGCKGSGAFPPIATECDTPGWSNLGSPSIVKEFSGTWAVPSPVPLPAALPLFLSALAGLGLMGWRRRADA